MTAGAGRTLEQRSRAASQSADHGVWCPRATLATHLRELADFADAHSQATNALEWDSYGERGPVAALEQRVAGLLGTQDAAYFPSGVMAQQIALRIWTDRLGSRRVALPDVSHLIVHEEDGPQIIHGLEFLSLTTGTVTPTARDVEAIPGELGAILIELPLRDAGYLLPTWDDLVAVSQACRSRGVPLHLDGARLWESTPRLGHELPEIVALADSVYVSFYKGLGALSGACLAGDADFVSEARLWRRRMGGTVWTTAPHALSALDGLGRALPRMGELYDYSRRLAAALQHKGVRTFPTVPHTNAFRVFLERDCELIRAEVVRRLEADRLALPFGWRAAEVPGWCFTELTVTEPLLLEDVDQVAQWFVELAQPPGVASLLNQREGR